MTTDLEMFLDKVKRYEGKLHAMAEGLDARDRMALSTAMHSAAAFYEGFALYGTDTDAIVGGVNDVTDGVARTRKRHVEGVVR